MADRSDAPHVALVTGASRGLGLAIAKELARRGWTLIIDARGAEALGAARHDLEQLHPEAKVIALAGDVALGDHQRELAAAAQSAGGIHLLINNASILGPSPQPVLLDYPLDVLRQVFEVNTLAPLRCIQ